MTADSVRFFFAVPATFMAAGLVIFALAWLKLPGEARS